MTQRTREIGIRVALGASRTVILRWVLKQGIYLTAGGIAFGLLGALVLTRLLRTLLFGVGPTDAMTYIALSVLLTLVALVACYIPARRANENRSVGGAQVRMKSSHSPRALAWGDADVAGWRNRFNGFRCRAELGNR